MRVFQPRPCRRALCAVGLLSLLMAGLSPGASGEPGPGSIRIAGSGTLEQIVARLAQSYRRDHPEVSIEIESLGSSTGPPALLTGRADLASMSRPLNDAERTAFQRRYGAAPVVFAIAVDAVVVYVNERNPLEGLTLPQLDAVFSSTRRCGAEAPLRTWGDVGAEGDWAEREIQLFGRDARSGTRAFFRTIALCGGVFRGEVRERPGPRSVLLSVAESTFGIGYGSRAKALERGVKALALARADGEDYAGIEAAEVQSGAYPLVRRLELVAAPANSLPAPLADFLAFALSAEGQAAVEQLGYLSAPPRLIEVGRAQLR